MDHVLLRVSTLGYWAIVLGNLQVQVPMYLKPNRLWALPLTGNVRQFKTMSGSPAVKGIQRIATTELRSLFLEWQKDMDPIQGL